MNTKFFIVILTLFLSSAVKAHGEDKLGPNGGYIRMPGDFHIEVVPQGNDQIHVYLLDINWKNPSIKASSVKAQLKDKKRSDAECNVRNNFYLCTFGKGKNLNHGQLIIEAKRESQSGPPVSYDLPLRLENSHDIFRALENR